MTVRRGRRDEVAAPPSSAPVSLSVASRSPRLLGRVPAVAAIIGVGLMLCSIADALARATILPSVWIYWAGVGLIAVPVFYRLCSTQPTTRERLALVCMLGVALYAVKLMRDPFGFTLPDEFPHAFNVEQILLHHKLFASNPILPITSDYPGLEGATSALAMLTGMSGFAAGIIIIFAARLLAMVGLFVLFGEISRSSRVAGLGAAVYVANSNFLLWSAQFAYESLALPLLIVVLACIASRDRARASDHRAWTIPIVLGIAAVVPTHHLTGYLLVLILFALTATRLVLKKSSLAAPVWPLAALSLGLTLAWLVVVASATVGYISPVVGNAFKSTLQTITGESAPHAAFSAPAGAVGANQVNDLGEKLVAFGSILLALIGVVLGFMAGRRRYRLRHDPLVVLMLLAAVGYFGATALRLAPAAWEVANRMAEFFFIGVGFVIGSIPLRGRWGRHGRWPAHGVIAVCGAILVIGGAIAGWSADTRLANPTVILADGHRIESESIAIGRWVGSHLAPGATFVAPDADAQTIMLYGRGNALTLSDADADQILTATSLKGWELALWRADHVRYVVVDLRKRATDIASGYYFGVHPPAGPTDILRPVSVATRFDDVPLPRIFDSGDIRVYDLQRTQ